MDNELVLSFQSLDDRPGHPGGRRPEPLKTTWMMREREVPPPRKTVHVFYLDEISSGTTVAQAADIESAVECMTKLAEHNILTYIRPFTICEESYEEDKLTRRWKAQIGC